MIARASPEWSTVGVRMPSGASIWSRSHDFTPRTVAPSRPGAAWPGHRASTLGRHASRRRPARARADRDEHVPRPVVPRGDRGGRGRPERRCRRRSGEALAARRCALRGDPRHARPLRPRRQPRRPRRADRRAGVRARRRAGPDRGARPPSRRPGSPCAPRTPDVWLDGGETVDAAGISFAVTLVPGHSPGHLAYFADGDLFSGDVLFAGSVGRTDLPGGDWDTLQASIALAPRRVSARRPSSTRATARRRRSEPSSRATRSSPTSGPPGRSDERQDRASARHARRRPRRDAALAARHRRGRAALRAVRLPARC